MKRIHTALVLATAFLAVVAFAPTAGASPVNVGQLEVNAGYAKSSNDATGNNESMGGGIAFGAGYWRSASPAVTWGAELSFDNLGSVDYNNGVSTGTVSSHTFRVTPELRYNIGAGVGPSFYAQAGAGLYSVSSKVEDNTLGTVTGSSSKFGYNLGAGVNFPVGPATKMNFTGLYHSVSTDGETLHYMQFRAGIGFGL
ncbi:MAG: outer membrane beta-barrel protein [Hyphomicrobiales bacterium]